MATLETQYQNWLKKNEPIEYSEWLKKFSEIYHLDKIIKMKPCDFDHNGECLICDCCISDCAYQRYINEDYKYESKEHLEKMFKNFVYKK
jgi:heterodisulfide reductase subunit C